MLDGRTLSSLHLYNFVLDNASRMLSWIDRRPGSLTYGCSDRNYWHYKIVDFPCAMLQETALTLALLYSTKFEGNDKIINPWVDVVGLSRCKYGLKISTIKTTRSYLLLFSLE